MVNVNNNKNVPKLFNVSNTLNSNESEFIEHPLQTLKNPHLNTNFCAQKSSMNHNAFHTCFMHVHNVEQVFKLNYQNYIHRNLHKVTIGSNAVVAKILQSLVLNSQI